MKVILKTNLGKLGDEGQVVIVKDGHARNFLIPKGYALPATGKNLNRLHHVEGARQSQEARRIRVAKGLAEKLDGVTVSIAAKVGEQERLFGTVTAMDIAEALLRKGIEVDKRRIAIPEPIKSLGLYDVAVKFHPDVRAVVKVDVVRE